MSFEVFLRRLNGWLAGPDAQLDLYYALAGLGLLLVLAALLMLLQRRRRQQPWKDRATFSLVLLLAVGVVLGGVASFKAQGMRRQLGRGEDADEVNEAELTKLRSAALPQASEAAAAAPQDWPQWRGPNRDGLSPDTGLLPDWKTTRPRVLWKHPVNHGYSSMAIAGGRVYTMDSEPGQERVLCLDARTGKERWIHSYPADNRGIQADYAGTRATPTVAHDRVYTVGATGIFLCLDSRATAQAHVLWQHDLMAEFDASVPTWGVACSPLVDGDRVYVQPGGKKGSVAAFDRLDGKLVWTALQDESGYSSPVAATIDGVHQIICFTGKGITGLRAEDGQKLWYHEWLTSYNANIATPIVASNYVFISSDYGAGCALLHIASHNHADFRAEPVYVKRNKLMRNHHASCVLHNGDLFGFDVGPGILRCINLRTGQEAWSQHTPAKGSLLWADGKLIILLEDGTLLLADDSPKAFQPRGQIANVLEGSDCWAMPALAHGLLYVRNHQRLVCLDIRNFVQVSR